jgi:cell division protein ZapE
LQKNQATPDQLKIINLIEANYKTFCSKNKGLFSVFAKAGQQKSRGFYIHGISGSGKTTLVSKFFEDANNPQAINMHFSDYFADIARLLQKYNYKQIAAKIAAKTNLLCFDEFFVESIADAKILFDLFKELFKLEIFIVATSNFAPDALFEGGFNRDVVFPEFAELIANNLQVVKIDNNNIDHRLNNQEQTINIFTKNAEDSERHLNYIKQTEGLEEDCKIDINPDILRNNNFKSIAKIAIFDYAKILKAPLSVKNIIQIARQYHLVCIVLDGESGFFEGFSCKNEDEAIRLRDLIDILYLRSINIMFKCNSDVGHFNIFDSYLMQKKEFIRTSSRLSQMSWVSYIKSKDRFYKRIWSDKARSFFEEL